MKIKQLLALLAIGAGLSQATSTEAQNILNWQGGDGDFFDPTHWDLQLIPGTDPTDIIVIDDGSTATIAANAGTRSFGGVRLGSIQDGLESGHIVMNGGTLNLGGTEGDPKAVIGNSATLSTFIMNGGTINFDGPDAFPGSTSDDGVNGLDWEVGENGLGRFEMHNDAKFFAGDDLKIAESALGSGSVLVDGNAHLAVGSGISVSGGGETEQTMVIAGNAVVDSGNSMGAGNPQGLTDEGYLTMATGGGRATVTIQENGVLNIRRLTARDGVSSIVVKDHGQFHIFDVLRGNGSSAAERPAEQGPGADNNNSTYPSAAGSEGTILLQDDAVMTVNANTEGVVKGLGLGGPRGGADPGGNGTLRIQDRATFRVEQDLGLGAGRNPETSSGTLEITGPSATINIGNLNMAVDTDGNVYGDDGFGTPTPGKAILSEVITGATHSTVNVSGVARIANGQLKVKLSSFNPPVGTTYTLIQGGSIEGQFASTDFTEAGLPAGLSWNVSYTPTAVQLKVEAAPAGRVVTVTTADNENPAQGEMSLVMALAQLQDGDTIKFNIPGAGPHYIKTPFDGYPLITKDNVTIDGYSQPGATPNTNPIHAANNAKLQIVLDSREGGRTVMNYNTGRPGYGDSETSILGVFNAANVTIKGLCFLGLHTQNSDEDPAIYCIAFARDHFGAPDYDNNGHVAGCWFGVEPDGTSVTGGSAAGIAFFRHRDVSGGDLPELPNKGLIVGVAPGSTDPRSEFNIFVDQSYSLAGEAIDTRVSGNFMGMLPDGVTPYDMVALDRPFAGATMEIGRYNDSTIITGTDGDGVNDADEGNVFGPLSNGSTVISFYGTGNKTFLISGNYFGVTADGATSLPGYFRIAEDFGNGSFVQFGSDFNGVSDAVEGNLVSNNHPWDPQVMFQINPIGLSDGARISIRGNSLINNFPLPVDPTYFTTPTLDSFYLMYLMDPSVVIPVITSAGSELVGTVPVPVSTFVTTIVDVYEADPEGITNGKTLESPEMPDGFVQGRTYLGSFEDNSSADLDPELGVFRFNASALNLSGKTITITANYSEQPVGSTNAVVVTSPFSAPVEVTASAELRMTITSDGSKINIAWPSAVNATLEATDSLSSPIQWNTVGTSNPAQLDIAPGNRFFRLKQ